MRVKSSFFTPIFYVLVSCITNDGDFSYPEELSILIKEKKCDPQTKWFESRVTDIVKKKEVSPPYLFKVNTKNKISEIYFWCTEKDGLNRLFVHKLPSSTVDCPELIDETYSSARGLSFKKLSSKDMNRFWRRDLKTDKVEDLKDILRDSHVIESSYDGVGDYFYCHKQKWWQQGFD